MSGYHVGYSFVPFKGPAGPYPADGGTVLFSGEARVKNSEHNADSVFRLYGPHAEQIDELIKAANAGLSTPVDARD